MGVQVASLVSEWRPVVLHWAVVVNRDLAGRGAALVVVFSLFLALADWLGPEPLPRSAWQELGLAADGPAALRRVSVRAAEDLEQLFAEHGFRLDEDDPVYDVPRLAVVALPRDMAKVDDPAARKALFLRTLLPLVLEANRELR